MTSDTVDFMQGKLTDIAVEVDSPAAEDHNLEGGRRILVEALRIPAVVVDRSWVEAEGSHCYRCVAGHRCTTVLERKTSCRRIGRPAVRSVLGANTWECPERDLKDLMLDRGGVGIAKAFNG